MLADLFELIQIDKILPREIQILKLFQLTKYLKSPVLANEMLRWFCGMSVEYVKITLIPFFEGLFLICPQIRPRCSCRPTPLF